MVSKVSVDEANVFLDGAFEGADDRARVTVMEPGRAVVQLVADGTHLRPGGYISGPTQMAMVDRAVYMAVMTETGITPMAVTSNFTMNFLRPCIGDTVEADARLIKRGRTLAVAEVDVRIVGADKPSSHAVVTYSMPRETE